MVFFFSLITIHNVFDFNKSVNDIEMKLLCITYKVYIYYIYIIIIFKLIVTSFFFFFFFFYEMVLNHN